MKEDKEVFLNEIWDDLVSFKDLILALGLSVGLMALGYYIAPKVAPYPMFIGLGGALLGFVISSVIIKPKRTVVEKTDQVEKK